MFKKISTLFITVLLSVSLFGCAGQSKAEQPNDAGDVVIGEFEDTEPNQTEDLETKPDTPGESLPQLEIQFGYEGDTFTLALYNNDTAAELARSVGSSVLNLPIYHYDDFEGHEVMQYYDIPKRYTIPSHPETVTAEKAGEVYYSDPNRIILFYEDAELSGEFTKVGYIVNAENLSESVENNPVLEGWGNKIISVSLNQTN